MKKFLFLLVSIVFIGTCFSQDLNLGLVAYYKFDGDLTNNGLANVTAVSSNTAFASNYTGVNNKAIQFAGNTSSYATITDNGNLAFNGDFSIVFGIYMTTSNTQGFYENGLNYGGCGIWYFSTDNMLHFNFKNGTIGAIGALPVNQWKSVCAVRSGGTLNLYINGVLAASGPEGLSTITYPNSPLLGQMYFAANGGNYNPASNGSKMDELRFYNRALSSSEILALSNDLFNTPAAPTVTSFSPSNGVIGSNITITGTNFNTISSNNAVFFGATKATVISATATTLTVTVPTSATYQNISVTNLGSNLIGYSAKPFNVTLSGNIAFASKQDKATGAEPYDIRMSDIDGDGKPDIAVTNNSSNNVSILRNTSVSGTVSTATKIDFTTGTNPQSLCAGDLDGDGKLDIVTANNGSGTISVLRNTSVPGTVSFATKIDFSTGASSGPASVSIGDIDGDGKPDLAVANNNTNTVSIFRNTSTAGAISFAAKTDFTTGILPSGVIIGDIDGDGKPDIAVSNFSSGTVSVFRNTSTTGSIGFAAKFDLTTGASTQPFYVSIGDLDGDGKSDLAVSVSSQGKVSVFRNTSVSGNISFDVKADFSTGVSPYGISIGDIDGDGKPDLAVGISGAISKVSVLKNTSISGTVSFAAKVDLTTGAYTNFVSIGDIDGDGRPDLIANNAGSNTLSILQQIAVQPQGSLNANGPFCSSETGQLTWIATSGAGPYIVVYSDGVANRTATNIISGTPFNVFTNPVINNTTYTVVSVTGSDNAVRSSGFTTATAIININTPPPAPAATGITICKYSNASLFATGIGTIGWYDASTGGNYLGGGTNFITHGLNTNTTYYVQDSTCAPSAARTPVIVKVYAPIVTAAASHTVVCSGSPVTLTGSGTLLLLYGWYGGGGVQGVYDGIPFIPLFTDTYIFRGSDSTGCDGTASVEVVVTPGTNTYYADADGDGYGSSYLPVEYLCSPTAPPGYSTNNTDCDDANPSVHAGPVIYNVITTPSDGSNGTITIVTSAASEFRLNGFTVNHPSFNSPQISFTFTDLAPGTYTVSAEMGICTSSSQTVIVNSSVVIATPPTVTTNAASFISASGAASGGEVTSDGGNPVTELGIAYGTATNPTITGTKTVDPAGTGIFSSIITGLSANTQYFIRAYATNSVNTAYGNESNFYTLANTPAAPILSSASITTLNIAIGTGDNNPATTEYAIYLSGVGQYVQANGSLGQNAVWQTAAAWGVKTITGLLNNNSYDFSVKARNAINTETSFGTSASITTLAITPGAPIVNAATESSLDVTIDVNGNFPWTTFAIHEIITNTYVQANGTLGNSPILQFNLALGAKTVTGLTASTTYIFEVKAINQDNIQTAFGTAVSGTTLCNATFITGQPLSTQTICHNATTTNLTVYATGASLTYQWYSNTINSTVGATILNAAGTSASYIPSSAIAGTLFYYCVVTGTCGAVTSDAVQISVGVPLPYYADADGDGYGSSYLPVEYLCSPTAPPGYSTNNTDCDDANPSVHAGPVIYNVITTPSDGSNGTITIVTSAASEFRLNGFTVNHPSFNSPQISFTFTDLAPGTYTVSAEMGICTSSSQTVIVNSSVVIATPPTVTTNAASFISASGAASGGEVTSDGGNPVTELGIAYGTATNPTITGTKTVDPAGTGIFSSIITGLSANTQYFIRAYATNSVNTAYGNESNFYTLANTPAAPILSSASITTLNIAIGTGDNNPATTEYAIYLSGVGQYVQANGSLGQNAVWQTAAAWGVKTITGLLNNNSYDFSVKARNAINTETSFGTSASITTLAITPGAPIVNAATESSLDVTIDVNGNFPWTTFAIHEIITNTYVQANGTLGNSPILQFNLALGAKTVTGLTASTTYIFEVKAINQDNIQTAFGTAVSGTTLCNATFITGQPLSTQTICHNATTTNLTVYATGASLTYQWYSNTINSTVGATILNAAGTSASYIPSSAVAGTLFYYCAVTGTCGSAVSNFAIVIVNSLPLVSAGTYGTYTTISPAVSLAGSPAGGIFSGIGVSGNTFNPSTVGVGNYNISYLYTDAITGCSNLATTTIVVNVPCNFSIDNSITGPANACSYITTTGINATYSITATSASSYNWVLPAGAILAAGTNTTNSILVHYASSFVSGTISVTVTSLCGGPVTKTLLITKTIPAVPAAITGLSNACPYIGTSTPVTYSIAPVAGALTYRWTLPTTVTLLSATPDSTSITIIFNTGFDAGSNKSIKVKSISGCGSSTDKIFTISVTKPAAPTLIAGPVNACIYIGTANTATYKTLTVANATSYTWTMPAGATIISHLNGSGLLDTVITVAFDNSFVSPSNISVQTVSGCGISIAKTIAVTRTIPATPGVITGITDACPLMGTANTATYTIRKVANATSYNWAIPSTATVSHPNLSGINDTVIVVSYGNTFSGGTITVNAANGCGSGSLRSLTITRNIPATPGTITGATDPCPFIGVSDATYTIRKVAYATSYTWAVPAGAVISGHPFGTGINDTAITVTFSNTVTSNNISVIANNNCASSSAKYLTLARKLAATPGVITGPTDPCPFIGVSVVTYSILKVANANSYTWFVPVGATIAAHPAGIGVNDTVITITYTNLVTTGNISVTANNNCASSLPRTLALARKLPAVPGAITTTVISAACPTRQYNYSIASLPANATSLHWTPPAGGTIISQGALNVIIQYGMGAVADTLRVVGVNNCASSTGKKLTVNLTACAAILTKLSIDLTTGSPQLTPKIVKQHQMTVKVFPNPSLSTFSLQFASTSNEVAMMRLVDVTGREVGKKVVVANGISKFGNDLRRGIYFIEVVQGVQTKTLKIIKF